MYPGKCIVHTMTQRNEQRTTLLPVQPLPECRRLEIEVRISYTLRNITLESPSDYREFVDRANAHDRGNSDISQSYMPGVTVHHCSNYLTLVLPTYIVRVSYDKRPFRLIGKEVSDRLHCPTNYETLNLRHFQKIVLGKILGCAKY